MESQPDLKRITEANRQAWNEAMPRHQKAAKAKWDAAFMEPGFSCLKRNEQELLSNLGLRNKNVVHLCCNNGVELLSIKNLGARKCAGFDISDEAIKEANERAQLAKIDCQFVRSDIYEVDESYNQMFDLAYISVGCLGWLPDLHTFFTKAAALLKANGIIFIHEVHPFVEMLPGDVEEGADCLRISYPYFRLEPYIEYGDLDYVGKTNYTSDLPQYWFSHTLSDIMMGLIDNRFTIEQFREYDSDISTGHGLIEQAKMGVPLSYILIARTVQ